jgi:CubicO group peptidase (beta-lactamase class C family)
VATIDRLTPELMKELHVPGVAIAVVSDRRLVWSKSYGVSDARSGDAVTNETRFEACSMSKPVFAYLALKLAEEGRLDLDRPLSQYLEEDLPPAQPERALVTARMVLSHTSGFPNWRKGDEERGGPLPVQFKPGSRFGYSGEGMFYLQRVVERITGEPLDVLAQRMLFSPAALSHMSYAWSEEIDGALASGHGSDGKFLQKTRYTHPNAAYSLYTTVEDYAKFILEIMKVDRSASHSLSQRSVDAMLGHQVEVTSRDPIERPGAARGTAAYWGLGWSLNATRAGDIVHHSGANRSGFRCFSQFCPVRGTAIVIMTNGLAGGDLWTRLISRVGDL